MEFIGIVHSSSFMPISKLGFDGIGRIESIFCKQIIILNILLNYLFSIFPKEKIKEEAFYSSSTIFDIEKYF